MTAARATFAALLIALVATARADDPYETYVRTSADFRRVDQSRERLIKGWPTFVYMPWTTGDWTVGYTDATATWAKASGYNGAFVDREPAKDKLAWIDKNQFPFYVDHLAGKGALHLWDGSANDKGRAGQLHGTGVRPVPLNNKLKADLKKLIRAHVAAAKGSPNRAAYALDDEVSWGHFVHPTMWQATDDRAAYPAWLAQVYGPAGVPKRDHWYSYSEIQPKLKTWTLGEFDASPLLDQWTFNDATWANFLGVLVTYANELDPATPVGFVGGQAPNAFGGYDYARLMRKVQFIEAYNIGGSQSIIRSFNPGNAMPAVTTHFHRDVADSVWQAWYYLARGNRGFIGWVKDWFGPGGTPKPWHAEVAPALREVEKVSKLMTGATWHHDGVAIYYSHPSIQLGWVLDAAAHGSQWTARNDDDRLGSSHLVRKAWENMLRDQGLAYSFVSYADVIGAGVPAEFDTLILPAALCLSDAEARQIRAFVERGGTVIADYLPGVWDQHGKGRAAGGALDDLFGVRHPAGLTHADVFGDADALWCETDQEANFSYKTYEQLLTKNNSSRKVPSGFDVAVRGIPIAAARNVGKGRAVLLNLSPQWYNAYRTRGPEAARAREVFVKHIPTRPRVRITGGADGAFGYEVTTWDTADGKRQIIFLTLHPELDVNELGGGNAVGLKANVIDVTLTFAGNVTGVRDERTGAALGAGRAFRVAWKVNEAVVLSVDRAK